LRGGSRSRLSQCHCPLAAADGPTSPPSLSAGGAKLKSADGLYKGEFFYPDDTGIPTYTFNNTKTGVVRTIITKKKPAAGGTASGHSAVNPSRRQVVSDTHTPKASWIVRSHCTGGAKPSSLKCNVDQDVFVPYECLFTVVTC
jgi:hypothetical protein